MLSKRTQYPIQLRDGTQLTFDRPAKQVIETHGVVIVRFESRAFDNVAAFDRSGKQLWRVTPIRTSAGFQPFSEIALVDDGLLMANHDQHIVVDPRLGTILATQNVRAAIYTENIS